MQDLSNLWTLIPKEDNWLVCHQMYSQQKYENESLGTELPLSVSFNYICWDIHSEAFDTTLLLKQIFCTKAQT